jgi:trans-aconitate 2-methyltransferase
METDRIADFYDHFTKRQLAVGVNQRHHAIRDIVLAQGLDPGMRVLEMGCGVGTLTGLLARHLRKGELVAVDLSPVSIEKARIALKGLGHVRLIVADVVNDALPGPFDRILLPDVLEHIPVVLHPALLRRIKADLAKAGRVIIHSPTPEYIEFLRRSRPELLQVVDQPLHLAPLATAIEAAGLIITRYQRHRIWAAVPEYMAIVLEHAPLDADLAQHHEVRRSWLNRLMARSASRVNDAS